FRSKYISFVSGVGHFSIDSKDNIVTVLDPPPPGPPFIRTLRLVDRDVQHTNVYLYSYIPLPKNVTLTLGASGDFFDTALPGMKAPINQFNPKFGITWNPIPDTTLRAAAFRTLKRTLITNQTLEPTQVAGFNQFFDDFNATRAWRYGGAIDQKFSQSIYGGLEYTFRDLEVPFVSLTPGGPRAREVDWEEKLFRAYLFWTPHEWVALSAGSEWERFVREKRFVDNAKHVETNRVPLGINFFHPSGLSAALKATYINQRGVFQREGSVTFQPGRDDFWVVDAAISYRLPKRYGFFSIGATNLFDKKFKYFDTDRGSVNLNPRTIPDRVIFGRLTLVF
ncbi:MAG: TonB-dependent receptor, partial [Nitrososphaera sp.]